jgi:hypothetical protein
VQAGASTLGLGVMKDALILSKIQAKYDVQKLHLLIRPYNAIICTV